MKYLLSCLLSCSLFSLVAQVQQITHQTFELSDTVTTVELDIYGTYKVEPWAGNTILVETQVRLYNASQNILDHLLEYGRYELEKQSAGSRLQLVSKDKERRAIKTSKGESFEEVEQKLYMPEEFVPDGENRWVRPSPLGQKTGTASPPVDTTGNTIPENQGY